MNRLCSRFFHPGFFLFLLITCSSRVRGAELTVHVRSPNDGSVVTQAQAYILIGGNVAIDTHGSGFFASAVPVIEGLNRIQVLGRATDGSIGRDTVTVRYEPGDKRSLDLEIFLEREKSLELEVEKLGKTSEQIQKGK